MNSIWKDNVQLPQFPKIDGDKKTDVLIIGGGMAGILCAWFLQQEGVDYCLVEADSICNGITKNTTAKITSQHGLIYQRLIKEFGVETASLYLESNELAVRSYRKLCKDIECDFEDKDSFVFLSDSPSRLEKEMDALNRIGYRAEFVPKVSIPVYTDGAVKFSNQAQFNPLKFIYGISRNLNIYEHTKVKEINAHKAKTDMGEITANDIIVATHFPINNKNGMYFMKMFQKRSYVLALKGAKSVNGMYIDGTGKGLSFRDYGDILLIGGGGHRTGEKGGAWREIEEFTSQHYPLAREYRRFAAQDCITLDGVPYIGPYGKRTEGLYVATGFNKWGMTSSMISGMLLRDEIIGKESAYSKLYNPSRTMLRAQLWANGAKAIGNLVSFSRKRCPHLGCALKWNKDENSWDCPCHGSRFEWNGELIDNPATDDLKI